VAALAERADQGAAYRGVVLDEQKLRHDTDVIGSWLVRRTDPERVLRVMRSGACAAMPLRQPLLRLNVGRSSLAFVRARILIAVAAWLLGAATATGGCLLAVSLLGDGFGVSGSSSQQLTVAAVNKALADAKRHPPAPAAVRPRGARTRPGRRRKPAATPSPVPAQPAAGSGTLFTSPAGTVVASCEPAGAYLLSWIPAQGYGVDRVARGPAPLASVAFEAGPREVTMRVSCTGGTPVSSVSSEVDNGGQPGVRDH
jgi:hypothetical protein